MFVANIRKWKWPGYQSEYGTVTCSKSELFFLLKVYPAVNFCKQSKDPDQA